MDFGVDEKNFVALITAIASKHKEEILDMAIVCNTQYIHYCASGSKEWRKKFSKSLLGDLSHEA